MTATSEGTLEQDEALDKAPEDEETEDDDDQVMDLVAYTEKTRQLVKLPTKEHPQGERFEIRLLDDFGVEDQHQILAWQRRYQKLMNSDEDLTPKQRDTLKFLLDKIFNRVLDAPERVKKDMTDPIRIRVMTAFTVAPMLTQARAQNTVIQKLIDKDYLTQSQVDEVMAEIRAESESTTAN